MFFSLSMSLLFAVLSSAVAEESSDPTEESLPTTEIEIGRKHLTDKKIGLAKISFEACIAAESPLSEMASDCHWELGWALWLEEDWNGVIKEWEASEKGNPNREGLSRYLQQARDNIGIEGLLAIGRDSAAQSYKSDVPEGTTVRLRAVGDMMIGSDFPTGYLNPKVDETFSDVSDWLSDADITFGNLEGPLCDTGKTSKCRPDAPQGSCYAFRSPTRYKDLFKAAGFDVMSTANNHAGDFGEICRKQTESSLDAASIAHTGRPGDIASLESNGLKIAVIGFYSGRSGHYLNDHESAGQLVRALDTTHDIVIVSFHGGAEGSKALHVPYGTETYYGENRGSLREFTHTVVDAGADLVWGHGPHVLRGMEVYNGRLIAYSMGNFATYGRFNTRGQQGLGVVLETVLDSEGRFVTGQLLASKQVTRGVPNKDPENKAIDVVRMLSSEDFPETGILVAQDGSIRAQ
jgi:poly-gamma-glutamate capsule biosynthesis protein CapA/YwtB (metallophosphatase superfamily)